MEIIGDIPIQKDDVHIWLANMTVFCKIKQIQIVMPLDHVRVKKVIK